jgi:threonine dehydrogenase-like Zn-dependent dehydrogenase
MHCCNSVPRSRDTKTSVLTPHCCILQIARQMGADIGILSGRTESPYAVGDRIKSVLGPDGPSVVIDCAGFEATMQVRPPACFRTRD